MEIRHQATSDRALRYVVGQFFEASDLSPKVTFCDPLSWRLGRAAFQTLYPPLVGGGEKPRGTTFQDHLEKPATLRRCSILS